MKCSREPRCHCLTLMVLFSPCENRSHDQKSSFWQSNCPHDHKKWWTQVQEETFFFLFALNRTFPQPLRVTHFFLCKLFLLSCHYPVISLLILNRTHCWILFLRHFQASSVWMEWCDLCNPLCSTFGEAAFSSHGHVLHTWLRSEKKAMVKQKVTFILAEGVLTTFSDCWEKHICQSVGAVWKVV